MSGFSVLPDPNKFRLEPGEPVVEPAGLGYGLLYNWYAATDARNIANTGWRVPTQGDIETLISYVDPTGDYIVSNVAGIPLKETGVVYWESPNAAATNAMAFNGRGSGSRGYSAYAFSGLGQWHLFWSSTPNVSIPGRAYVGCIYYTTDYLSSEGFNYYQEGLSIRLVKASTSLTHGQTGTYVGNDGKVYRTICIGTQEWLADNLCETRYRNGDPIPEVTDNAAWAALTIGAMCAYNNDWNNV